MGLKRDFRRESVNCGVFWDKEMHRGLSVERVSVDRGLRAVTSMFSVQCCVLCSSEPIVLQGGVEEKREENSGVFRGRELSSCPGS